MSERRRDGDKEKVDELTSSSFLSFPFLATLMNASSEKDIVFGSSTTALITNLAYSLENGGWLDEGDEIIVTDADHEGELVLSSSPLPTHCLFPPPSLSSRDTILTLPSPFHLANIGPWLRLARNRKCTIKFWKTTITPTLTGSTLELSTLAPLLSSKTRIVAFTACSNILGQAIPIKEVVDLVREKTGGLAKTLVDCVAFSPHQRMDVTGWGVDFAVFSYYKVSEVPPSLVSVACGTLDEAR